MKARALALALILVTASAWSQRTPYPTTAPTRYKTRTPTPTATPTATRTSTATPTSTITLTATPAVVQDQLIRVNGKFILSLSNLFEIRNRANDVLAFSVDPVTGAVYWTGPATIIGDLYLGGYSIYDVGNIWPKLDGSASLGFNGRAFYSGDFLSIYTDAIYSEHSEGITVGDRLSLGGNDIGEAGQVGAQGVSATTIEGTTWIGLPTPIPTTWPTPPWTPEPTSTPLAPWVDTRIETRFPTPTITMTPTLTHTYTPTPTPKYPKRAHLFHHQANVLAGNAIQITVSNSSVYCFYAAQTASAQNDSFSQGAFLKAGVYDFETIGLANNASGICLWTLDAVTIVAAQDWYSKSWTQNVTKVQAVTIATDGWHKLIGTCTGKNASSSNYNLNFTTYYFQPADDD